MLYHCQIGRYWAAMKQRIEPIDGEIWKPIPDFPSFQVSNLGRVASYRLRSPYIKKFMADHNGYCRIVLTESPEHTATKYIHLLVAHAFLPPKPDGFEIDHINGNPSDNQAINLRWCSHRDNIAFAMARRGNWLANAPKRKGPPIWHDFGNGYFVEHDSLASACKALGRPQTVSANLANACKNYVKAYGFYWTRDRPKRLIPPLGKRKRVVPEASQLAPAESSANRTKELNCAVAQ
jgi:hypothetical protein